MIVVIRRFLQDEGNDPLKRGLSWNYCYNFFQNNRPNKPIEPDDLACLHLGFYLASWGMYRGSGGLLKKNFNIYREIIRILFAEEFATLWEIGEDNNWLAANNQQQEVTNLFTLKQRLEAFFQQNQINNTTWDTLITKLLLGTMGCAPAYDTYFTNGLRNCNIRPLSFSQNSFANILNWCREHQNEINDVRQEIEEVQQYPLMKIVDMYFWRVGGGE